MTQIVLPARTPKTDRSRGLAFASLLLCMLVGSACPATGGPANDDAGAGATLDAGSFDGGTDGGSEPASLLREGIARRAGEFVGSESIEIILAGKPKRVPQLPTLVIGVVSAEFTGILAFARQGAPGVPNASSVYPISSISKLVTGLIAARGIVDGDYAPTTSVSALLGPDLSPLVGDRTLLELVTHTAGYHANPQDLDWAGMPNSPAAGYSRTQLAACLASADCSRARATRGQYLYSNLSLGVLGVALSDRHGVTYEQLLVTRLTNDLGMSATHTRAFADDSRLVGGTTLGGELVPPATMGILAPAGELLSTGDDMLRLVDTFVRPPAALREAVELATTPVAVGGQMAYAIDVVERRSLKFWSKSGDQAGYSSQIMWCPELSSGAFALTNLGMSSATLASLLIDLHVMISESR